MHSLLAFTKYPELIVALAEHGAVDDDRACELALAVTLEVIGVDEERADVPSVGDRRVRPDEAHRCLAHGLVLRRNRSHEYGLVVCCVEICANHYYYPLFFSHGMVLMTSVLRTMRMTDTPLSGLYFSEFNYNQIQNDIRKTFKEKTGIAIDYQGRDDVITTMRMVYINNSYDPYGHLPEQVKLMNDIVVKTAVAQVGTGVSQYIGYLRDISTPLVPEPRPIQTSYYGDR